MLATWLPDTRPPAVRWSAPPPVPGAQPPLPLHRAPAQPDGARHAPEPKAVALVVALVEAVSGRRHPQQLARWATDDVLAEVVTRRRAGVGSLTLRSLRMQRDGDRAELAARLQASRGHVALAVALHRQGERWLCTAAEFGPLPLAPDRT